MLIMLLIYLCIVIVTGTILIVKCADVPFNYKINHFFERYWSYDGPHIVVYSSH